MLQVGKQKTTGEAVVYLRANKRATHLSPSLPTKLADGLGLKDTPLAPRDTPRAYGSSALSALTERLGRQRSIQLSPSYHNYLPLSSRTVV